LSGKIYLSPAISDKVLEGYLKGRQKYKPDTSLEKLCQRDKEVLKSVGEGYSSLKIINIFCIGDNTVNKHRVNRLSKLNPNDASALAGYAIGKNSI
jgi:DNA-binding NarL/FixJ family response regulator